MPSVHKRVRSVAVTPETSLTSVQNFSCTSVMCFCSSYVTGTALVAVSEARACALGPQSSKSRAVTWKGEAQNENKKISVEATSSLLLFSINLSLKRLKAAL